LGGAVIAGIHLEGPFLSREHRGAHPEKYLLTPDARYLSEIKEFRDIIRTVTIAPEIEGALRAIKEFANWGVLVSGGHDMATEKIIAQAIANGMRHTTHIFCVMSELRKIGNYRTLGLNEYTLLDDRLTTEIIGDNRHIPPLLAKLIYKCKSSKGVCLISDCIRAAGMPVEGEGYVGRSHQSNSLEFVIRDGIAMIPDGSRFAGSITTIDTMIKNMVRDAGIGLNDAVRMATLTPAEIQGIDHRKGSLEVGKDGDIVIIDPDFRVHKTILAGRVVFQSRNVTGEAKILK
jgi:N-acetylglucosamine-6-phosphate deacetylase